MHNAELIDKDLRVASMTLFGVRKMSDSKANKSYGIIDGFFSQMNHNKSNTTQSKINIVNQKSYFKFEDKASIFSIQTPIHMASCQPFKTQHTESTELNNINSVEKHGDYFIQTLHDMSILKTKERKKLEEQARLKESIKENKNVDYALYQDLDTFSTQHSEQKKEEKDTNSIFSNMPEQIAKSFTQIFAQSLFGNKTDFSVEPENKSLRLAKEANWKSLTDDEFFSSFTKQIEASLIEKTKEVKLTSQLREISHLNRILKNQYQDNSRVFYERDVLMKKTLPLLFQKFNKLSFFHQDIKPIHLEMLEEAFNDIIHFLYYLQSCAVALLEQSFEEALLFVKQRYNMAQIDNQIKKT